MFPGGAGQRQLWDMKFNVYPFSAGAATVPANGSITLFTLNGKGIIDLVRVYITISSGFSNNTVINVVIDGVTYPFAQAGAAGRMIYLTGSASLNSGNSATVFEAVLNVKFRESFAITVSNSGGTAINLSDQSAVVTYHT